VTQMRLCKAVLLHLSLALSQVARSPYGTHDQWRRCSIIFFEPARGQGLRHTT
jgi:hypothetical protein